MRSLSRLGGGRFRIWWLCYGQRTKYALMAITMIGLYGIASEMDYQDALLAERIAHDQAKRALAQEQKARTLPPTVFVIEADTPDKAQEKLAKIAGDLDLERYKMRLPPKGL